MKLERFNNKKRQRMMVINLIIGIILFIGGISFYKTYALYETKKEYNVIKGTVPDFGYDVKLAVIVDDQKQDEIPNSPIGQDGNYYEVQVDCTSSKTEGLWDYNAWRLNLDYIESNSKCNLVFTSSMSKEQYDEYIKSGVALRRNTYRGKDITEYKSLNTDDPMNLYNQISNGTFADIYVGDYIKGSNGVTWLIADLDNYLGKGDQEGGLQTHHATIIPAESLDNAKMNSEATTKGGYMGSEMVTKTLGTVLQQDNTTILGKYIFPDFASHVVKYRNILTNTVAEDRTNMFGLNTGASSEWEWTDRYLDLMSEVNVFGTTMASSSFFDIGIDNQQYAIFNLRPELINCNLDGNRYWYWLKAVNYSKSFALVGTNGSVNATFMAANAVGGIRPRFLIG